MSEELKPCNVKECHYYDSRWDCHKGTARIHYTNCNRAYGRNKKTVQDCKLYVAWNTRPTETALQERAENAEYNFGVQLDSTKALQERLKQAEERGRELEGELMRAKHELNYAKQTIDDNSAAWLRIATGRTAAIRVNELESWAGAIVTSNVAATSKIKALLKGE